MRPATSPMTSDDEALLSLQGAGFRSRDRWLVRQVDLTVARGEIVTLIGPNGSGKSTTARMALGILPPTEGAARRSSGLRVGYVPQSLSIDWTVPLTVKRFMRLTSPMSTGAVLEALDRTGVPHLQHAEIRLLSGGEFQRVLLARAIGREPHLLVLDEPVQGVDFAGEIAIYDLISEIRRELDCGVLMISHDLHVVMAATDRVICLNGHVCCSGSPGAVANSDAYQALFGQRAAATLAVYEHHHDHTHGVDGSVQSDPHAAADPSAESTPPVARHQSDAG